MSDASVTEALLDAKGLACPLPVLRARKMLNGIPPGALLTVLATDPAAARDFDVFCRQTGHQLVESTKDAAGVLRCVIRKKV
jgi:tRNA 2-thiouridine synthesizing protein A